MEYYIMKLYEYKKKEEGLKIGLNRFSKKTKILVFVLLLAMILLSIITFVLMILFPKSNWFLFGAIPNMVTIIALFTLDNKDEKININQHIEEYKKKIEILHNILINDFHIDSKEKLTSLIQKYKTYIEKRNKEEKTRNSVLITSFSALSGLLSITFLNLNIIGIDFLSWLYIAVILLVFFSIACLYIYIYKYFDTLKHKYENMIEDLESLNLYKY